MVDSGAPSLLIVDDHAPIVRQLRWTLEEYDVATAGDRASAMDLARGRAFPVVLLDLGLPPDPDGVSEGLRCLEELLELDPSTKVIVVTGRGDEEPALRAVELGAYDFYRKPANADEIRFLVRRAYNLHRLEAENRRLARSARSEPLPGVVTASDGLALACATVERAATSNISVLFTGETGTGKELLARALHELSPRCEGPFVALNCSAIPEALLESELFGHERGAFTGAVRRSLGYVEVADGGTLFLDEVGDLPPSLQPKLLRFLEERTIQRVGGRDSIPVDLRIVSATHRDLEAAVADGSFREDLYYRIRELAVAIPPLRERPEDVLLLARHFFERYQQTGPKRLRGFDADALSALASHRWPGNVRELENRIKQAVLLSAGPTLGVADLDLGPKAAETGESPSLRGAVKEAERVAVAQAWAASGGNVSRAGEILSVSRPTVYRLLREHGIRA